MSSPMAIAAVTATLQRLLSSVNRAGPDLNDALVTAQPLDKARDPTATNNQLNLFLYLISPSAAWRNQDMPGRVKQGEVATPPLAINLFYLLSAYGRDNDREKPFSHLLLGHAMRLLHDHPLLGAPEIAESLQDNDLGDQVERVRITVQPLTIEEISKLWAGFQMQYRLSVAYEVAVVLIDSQRSVRAAPPVLKRGSEGRGFASTADPLAAFPTLISVSPSRPLRLGDTLRVVGAGLTGDKLTARWAPLRLAPPVDVPVIEGDGGLSLTVPTNAGLPAGPCLLSLRVDDGGVIRSSNELPLALAPKITSGMPLTASFGVASTISLTVAPAVLPHQSVALILGNRQIEATSRTGGQLRFSLSGVAPGVYLARVRVDGVDSLPLLDPDASIPAFDPAQTIEVTP